MHNFWHFGRCWWWHHDKIEGAELPPQMIETIKNAGGRANLCMSVPNSMESLSNAIIRVWKHKKKRVRPNAMRHKHMREVEWCRGGDKSIVQLDGWPPPTPWRLAQLEIDNSCPYSPTGLVVANYHQVHIHFLPNTMMRWVWTKKIWIWPKPLNIRPIHIRLLRPNITWPWPSHGPVCHMRARND